MHPVKPTIALLGFITLLIGCAQPEPPAPPPNVLLITIDALRADSVSWAGSSFDTTPKLGVLAADSAVFDDAVTSFPGTTASMPSMMTGLFPNFEGIDEWNKFTYHGFNEFETPEEAEKPIISDNLQMVAETLRSHGFRTLGFNTNPNLTQYRNFNQGFTDYDDFGGYMKSAQENRQHPLEAAYPPADVVMAKVVPALRTLGERPTFMWVHLMESHSPYLPPEPHSRVSPRTFTDLPDIEINGALYHFLHRQWGADPAQIVHPSLEKLGISKAEFIEHLLGLYEGEIHFCDAQLGGMLTVMDELGMLDNTLIIITADHGEEFFDHGYVTHHFESKLAEELIRIPLSDPSPGRRSGRDPDRTDRPDGRSRTDDPRLCRSIRCRLVHGRRQPATSHSGRDSRPSDGVLQHHRLRHRTDRAVEVPPRKACRRKRPARRTSLRHRRRSHGT